MRRTTFTLVVTLAVSPASYSQSVAPSPAEPAPSAAVATVAERAAFYQRIAGTGSTRALEQLARELVGSTLGATQRWRLEAIADRYFELEPAGAVRFAGELRRARGPDLTVALYERLARHDVNAALGALSQIDDASEASAAAMATFRGLGSDERAYELVAASVYGPAAQQFRADALVQLATMSSRKALAEALALPTERRAGLAMLIVERWAADAPLEAMAAVERVRDADLQRQLRGMVLRAWSDVAGLAAYLEGLDVDARREALANGALYRLEQHDPRRAAELVAELPPSEQRQALLRQIATSYAQRDPSAALAWVKSLETPDPQLIGEIVGSVAFQDPVKAFDLAGTFAEPMRSQFYFRALSGRISDESQFSALARRMFALDESQTKTALLVNLVGSWASRPNNVEPTLDWMLANGAALPPEAFERVGYVLASSNPNAAAAWVDRVPRGARGAWIAAVATGYASSDPQAAVTFVERFRGDPAFDRAAVALTQQLASVDPPGAARLLASVGNRGAADGFGPEVAIARSWAQRDPAAAAAWAVDLPLPARNIALQFATATWGAQDPEGVRDWALRQPAGEKRDAALGAAVRARGNAPPDPALLNAFSDDRARQGAVMTTILATAQTDASAARRLIDAYVTDPRARAQAEQMVDSFARGGRPPPTGAIGITPAGPPFVINAPAGIVRPPGPVFSVAPGAIALPPGASLPPQSPVPSARSQAAPAAPAAGNDAAPRQ